MPKTKTPANVKAHCQWTMTVPVLSTQHITRDDAETLVARFPEISGFMGVLYGECGFLINVEDPESDIDDIKEKGIELSDHYFYLLRAVHSEKYIYLRLDPDGQIIPGLPTYNW